MIMNGINQGYYNPYQPKHINSNYINWVQGPEGAKAYQIMPNSNVVLMDSEADRFYIKSSDNIGMCSLRVFSYKEETDKPKEEYVTRSELEEVLKKYEQALSRYDKSTVTKAAQQSSSATGNETNKR